MKSSPVHPTVVRPELRAKHRAPHAHTRVDEWAAAQWEEYAARQEVRAGALFRRPRRKRDPRHEAANPSVRSHRGSLPGGGGSRFAQVATAAQERLALAGAEDLGAGVKLAAKSAGGKWDLVGAVLGEARTLELMSSTVRDLPPLLGSMVRKDRLDTVEVMWPPVRTGAAAHAHELAFPGAEVRHTEASLRTVFRGYGAIARVKLAAETAEASAGRAVIRYRDEGGAARASQANPRPRASHRCDCAALNGGSCRCPRFRVELRLPRPPLAGRAGQPLPPLAALHQLLNPGDAELSGLNRAAEAATAAAEMAAEFAPMAAQAERHALAARDTLENVLRLLRVDALASAKHALLTHVPVVQKPREPRDVMSGGGGGGGGSGGVGGGGGGGGGGAGSPAKREGDARRAGERSMGGHGWDLGGYAGHAALLEVKAEQRAVRARRKERKALSRLGKPSEAAAGGSRGGLVAAAAALARPGGTHWPKDSPLRHLNLAGSHLCDEHLAKLCRALLANRSVRRPRCSLATCECFLLLPPAYSRLPPSLLVSARTPLLW
jgi:uncharacterized membrane protein YgcG